MTQIIETLNFLSYNASQIIAENAILTLQYKTALDQQEISQEEYLDLMQDLYSRVSVAEAADDLNNKILLEQCIKGAIAVAGAI